MSQVLGNPLDELRLRTDFQGQPTLSQTGNTIFLIGNAIFPIRKMPHSPPRDRPPHRAAESGFPPRFANGHAHEYSSTRFMPDRTPPGISILLHGGNAQLQSGGTGEAGFGDAALFDEDADAVDDAHAAAVSHWDVTSQKRITFLA